MIDEPLSDELLDWLMSFDCPFKPEVRKLCKTIHLPPPPADKWVWFGCIGVLIYEN